MDKTEVRVVIKYFCKKGMSLKEIHLLNLGESGGGRRVGGGGSVDDYEPSGHPKEVTTDENV